MAITALPTPPSRSSPSDFSTKADAFIAALPVFVTEANAQAAALDLNDTTTTSTTSLTIGTGSTGNIAVEASKSFQPGMSVKIARTAAPSNWMHGDVTSYSGTTLVVNVTTVLGSGTYTDWTVTFSAPVNTPAATAEADFIIADASPFTWLKKTLAQTKTILGLLSNVPAATAESDFMVSTTTPFAWVKKTLVEAKALLGLVVTAGKAITVTQNTALDEAVAMSAKLTMALGTANLKAFMNAAGTAAEWANGIKVKTFSRVMTAADADIAYTGYGFKPSAVVIIGTTAATKYIMIGFCDSSLAQSAVAAYTDGSAFMVPPKLIGAHTGGGYEYGELISFDTDGFTIRWTSASPPTITTTFAIIAFR